ncbi:twin-arginine translocase TatA/TatE family subunit [Anaeromyxobacter oryzisoli]|jgi:sec-independent protein translocase protein TatA|uniref:twin-arginine translocase TatA/TatE family subunit n=1 Tax=Anaeromyxobacter oryzisoli TaxID=2925408 RepID=UPI0027DEBCC8|nr:twin-arginine translocase TatA/TatE family subunit [Anaeromyxobacter sp. SG63]
MGFPELIVILLIVVLLFGSSKLPQLGEGVGKAIRGFKDAMKEPPARKADAPKPPEGGAQP